MYNHGEVHAHDKPAQGRRLRHARRAPALLDLLSLRVGAKVDIGVENGRLVVEARKRPSYSLDELLAQCEETDAPSTEDRAWLDAKAVGNELL